MHVELSYWLHETFISKIIYRHFWHKLMVGAQIMGQFNVLHILICQSYHIHCKIEIINDF
jgi:hypothetical protein